MSILELQNISFSYKQTPVISNLNLNVEQGEFCTLLGSSGCGKTTILRLISGFLEPQKGTIKINGQIQNGILPNKRKIGMVFQDYALFPHLTVEENLLYGLKLQKDFKKNLHQNNQLVLQTAQSLGIENLLNRFPSELSGGQQQRVALGRSLVLQPQILLMDEPLSSLDTKLRIKVRDELKEIQQNLKITTIYVTHDQEEALSLSDKIAVMNQGKIMQYDSPNKIYFKPDNHFTADFIGRSNFIQEENITYLVRPEWISITKNPQGQSTIVSWQFLGDKIRYKVQTPKEILTADISSVAKIIETGTKVDLEIIRKWKID